MQFKKYSNNKQLTLQAISKADQKQLWFLNKIVIGSSILSML